MIVASSISTTRIVRVKMDRKKYVSIYWFPSPTTLGTFGTQFEIHCSPSDWLNLPLITSLDNGNCSISWAVSDVILSCKLRGFSGISSMAHIGWPEVTLAAFSTINAFRLPYYPSAVLIFIYTFLISDESILSVVSIKLVASFYSRLILFSLHILSLMLRISTDWLLCRSIVSIGL